MFRMPAFTTAGRRPPRPMLMALAITRRFGEVVVAESVHPEYRQVLATFLEHLEPKLVTVPAHDGQVTSDSIARAAYRSNRRGDLSIPEFPGPARGRDRQSSRRPTIAAHWPSSFLTRSASACSSVRSITARISPWPKASRWAITCASAALTWASWSAARNTCGRCRAGSWARRRIGTANAAGC